MATEPAIRIARCPQCGASSRLDERNAFRPFCSERCKLLDLGAWFDGRHAIPAAPSPEDLDDDNP